MTIEPSAATPPPGGLQLRTRYWALSFMLAMATPRIEIDGGPPVAQPWGDCFVWVAPGQHLVRVSFRWMLVGRAGDAAVTVVVPAGHAVHLDYEAPRWFVFLPGRWTVGVTQPLAHAPNPPTRPEAPTAATTPAGWFADPGGRHEHRYWDGTRWTEHVADAGIAAIDPPSA